MKEQLKKVTEEINKFEAELSELREKKQALATKLSQTKVVHQMNKTLPTDDKSESDQSQKTSSLKNG